MIEVAVVAVVVAVVGIIAYLSYQEIRWYRDDKALNEELLSKLSDAVYDYDDETLSILYAQAVNMETQAVEIQKVVRELQGKE